MHAQPTGHCPILNSCATSKRQRTSSSTLSVFDDSTPCSSPCFYSTPKIQSISNHPITNLTPMAPSTSKTRPATRFRKIFWIKSEVQ
ncbi:unnamed protein product [Rotaria sordida]|uniref:Uncharacterized protein n=1 Tax=Rotaria sordida TaxID=392033 RepID=A0A815C5G2_9BILA|nr:unnamed protein product [Rotaria sordida]CAF1259897.1 unnamed protein product [Rotaria sordida]CAF1282480.1 unnamed protein product [Rotaria sordida]